jgi:hypothetical protein
MAYYATVNGDGLLTSFYSDVLGTPPEAAFPITDEVWLAWQADTMGQRWNGTELEPYSPPPVTPTAIRTIRGAAFRERIPAARRAPIAAAAVQAANGGDGTLVAAMLSFASAQTVALDSPEVNAAVDAMRTAGAITQAEADALLANGAPGEAA